MTVFEEHVYLYVPRHGRHTFVEKLDLLCGLGHAEARRAGRGPRGLVSDLGVFGFDEESGAPPSAVAPSLAAPKTAIGGPRSPVRGRN